MNPKYLKYFEEISFEQTEVDINSRVLIVDGLNQYIRAFATSPVTNEDGLHVGGITGFFLTIGSAIKQLKPTRVILVFDGRGGSQKRREVYSEYKNNRKPGSDIKRSAYLQTDEDVRTSMIRQMARLQEYLDILPVTTMIIDHIEADDTIAYLTTLVKEKNGQSFIMSTDRDFLQLVDDTTHVWSPTKKKLYFRQDVVQEYGISATNFLTYRTIIGDKGDNLPKVKGIGPGTLLKHIPEFGHDIHISVDDLFEICKSNLDNKVFKTILANEELIRVNHQLMQLKDVNISGINKLKIMDMFEQKIAEFVKPSFFRMLADDRMATAIKSVEMWSNEVFNPLHIYSKKYLETRNK